MKASIELLAQADAGLEAMVDGGGGANLMQLVATFVSPSHRQPTSALRSLATYYAYAISILLIARARALASLP